MSRTRWPHEASRRDAAAPAGPPPRIKTSIVGDAELLEGGIRTTVPSRDRPIPHVLQIVDAHAGGPEAGGGQIAEAAEERHTVRELDLCTGRPCNVVEHRRTLCVGAIQEHLVEALLAFVIEPGQPSTHRHLPRRLV